MEFRRKNINKKRGGAVEYIFSDRAGLCSCVYLSVVFAVQAESIQGRFDFYHADSDGSVWRYALYGRNNTDKYA